MKNLLSALLIVVLSVAFVYAQNSSAINQVGGPGNSTTVNQTGDLLTSDVSQDGDYNNALIDQKNIGSYSEVDQTGSSNYADVTQQNDIHTSLIE